MPVASDLEGNIRICEDCGYSCKQKNSSEFADAIEELYRDRGRYTALSEASKEKYLEKYTSRRMAREVEDFYISLLK